MIRTLLLAAALSVGALPALAASEWMGSINFTKNAVGGATSATWTAKLKNGEGKAKVDNGMKLDVQKSNSFFIISQKGSGVVGTGMVHKGHVVGTFKVGKTFAGTFDGSRTSKGKSSGSKGKK